MSLLHKYHQFHLLSEFLKNEGVPDAYPIYFREESEADNRFALRVSVENRNGLPGLLRKLAEFFGCPQAHLPEEGEEGFEASDDWHGSEEPNRGDLRELADEIGMEDGPFFDIEYAVGKIHHYGAKMKADELARPANRTFLAVLLSAMLPGQERDRDLLEPDDYDSDGEPHDGDLYRIASDHEELGHWVGLVRDELASAEG